MNSRDDLPRGALPSGILKMEKILSGTGCSYLNDDYWRYEQVEYLAAFYGKLGFGSEIQKAAGWSNTNDFFW